MMESSAPTQEVDNVSDVVHEKCHEPTILSETTENDDDDTMDDEEEPESPVPAQVQLVAEDGRPLTDIEVAARYADLEIQSMATKLATTTVDLSKTSTDVKSTSRSSDDQNQASVEETSVSGQVDESDDSSSDEEEEEDRQKLRAEIEAALEKEEVKASGPLKTVNEVALPIREPEVELTSDCPIARCGVVLNVSRPGLMVTVKSDANLAPLDEGSILCFEDRTVLGCVDEIFGPVMMPMYLIRFENVDKIPAQTDLNKVVFYATEHTKYVNPENIRDKGTDASNLYDEEADEAVFSDDEAEAAAKRANKKRNREYRTATSQSQHSTSATPRSFTEYHQGRHHTSHDLASFQIQCGRGRGRGRGGQDGGRGDFQCGGRGEYGGFRRPVQSHPQGGFTRYTNHGYPSHGPPPPMYNNPPPGYAPPAVYGVPSGPYTAQQYNPSQYHQHQFYHQPPLPGHQHLPQYPPQAAAPGYYHPPMPDYTQPPQYNTGGYYPPPQQHPNHSFNPPQNHQTPPFPPQGPYNGSYDRRRR